MLEPRRGSVVGGTSREEGRLDNVVVVWVCGEAVLAESVVTDGSSYYSVCPVRGVGGLLEKARMRG